MTRFCFGLLLTLSLSASLAVADDYTVASPDGHMKITVRPGSPIRLSVSRDGRAWIPSISAALELSDKAVPAAGATFGEATRRSVHETIPCPVGIKNSSIIDNCNELTLPLGNEGAFVVRAYDDAAAYRFETKLSGRVEVRNEVCDVDTGKGTSGWFQSADRWMNPYEHLYDVKNVADFQSSDTIQLPFLLKLKDGGKVLVTESDLVDYPGLYFTGTHGDALHAIFPPKVKSEKHIAHGKHNWDRIFKPKSHYGYIAETSGTRSFPWRIFALAEQDSQLLNNEIVMKLAQPCKLDDTSWIKPGQVAWDWWNDWNITGVDFKSGPNTKTYMKYIDFAAKNHIPYIILDEGWYELGDLTRQKPDMDVKALAEYGRKRGVGIILWCVWRTLDQQMQPAMDLFQRWGIRGVKVDFMNRDDQDVVNFYWRCAEAAAKHHMLVDYHGCHKPTGISRAYPNVVNFEGVDGLEQDKWSEENASPDMAVTIPYIRMFAGPLDYTPGAMRNATKKDFRPIFDNPMSMGTRCQQLAMYVVFDAPLQMLADKYTAYEKEPESLKFITSVPTTWERTIPLGGSVGEYVVTARKHGSQWFVGAMTNWSARDIDIDFSFLPEGKHSIVIFQDGVNADRNAEDYKRVEKTVTRADKMRVHLAPGGGWAARID